MDATVVLPALAALLHLPLNHLESVRVDDGLVVVLHVVLRAFALIDLLFSSSGNRRCRSFAGERSPCISHSTGCF